MWGKVCELTLDSAAAAPVVRSGVVLVDRNKMLVMIITEQLLALMAYL